MSKYRARLGSRKYYKKAWFGMAWRFGPTGAAQLPINAFSRLDEERRQKENSIMLGELTEMINNAMRNEIARSILADREL